MDDLLTCEEIYPPPPSPETIARCIPVKEKEDKKFIFKIGTHPQWGTTYRIAHTRDFIKGHGRLPAGFILNCVVQENKIIFRSYRYTLEKGKFKKVNKDTISLVYKNGSFNCYYHFARNKRTRITFFNLANILGVAIKKPRKIHNSRIKRLVKQFLRKHGYKYNKVFDLDVNVLLVCYPGLKYFPLDKPPQIRGFSHIFKYKEINKVFKAAFGVSGRKIKKVVFERFKDCRFDSFLYGRILKGLVPYEFFYDLIHNLDRRRDNWLFSTNAAIKDIRQILSYYPKERIMILAKDLRNYYLQDTLRMYRLYGADLQFPDKPSDFREIHDFFSRQSTALQYKDIIFELKPEIQSLNAAKVDNLEIEVPTGSATLVDWGRNLSNCIASYSHSMKNKECLLLGIKENNNIKYAIEIRDKSIRQFSGKYNNAPDPLEKEKVVKFLAENNLIRKNNEEIVYQPL